MLILTGGEPLLRPDLETLISRATELGMTVVLGTNGTLLTSERAFDLAQCGLSGVGISLDSVDSRFHDEFRGRDGAWLAAVRGLTVAREADLDVQIHMTLTRRNISELSDVVRFTRDAGARALVTFFLVCTGRGQDLVDLTAEEYECLLLQISQIQPHGIMIRPRCAPTFRRVLAQTDPDSVLLESDAARCMAGKSYCRITPSGEVTPCPYMPLSAGDLRSNSFAEIWASSPLLQSLRNPSLKGRCGLCEYRELCGGCRARALSLNDDPLAEDPWCSYVPGTDKPPSRRKEPALAWTPEAECRLEKVPLFARRVVRKAVEAFARGHGVDLVTPQVLNEARQLVRRP